jgi:hypothetical protein
MAIASLSLRRPHELGVKYHRLRLCHCGWHSSTVSELGFWEIRDYVHCIW